MLNESLKKNLFDKIEQINDNHIQDVMNFIEHILKKQDNEYLCQEPENREPYDDPILRLIGNADTEPFSHVIDDELYGD